MVLASLRQMEIEKEDEQVEKELQEPQEIKIKDFKGSKSTSR